MIRLRLIKGSDVPLKKRRGATSHPFSRVQIHHQNLSGQQHTWNSNSAPGIGLDIILRTIVNRIFCWPNSSACTPFQRQGIIFQLADLDKKINDPVFFPSLDAACVTFYVGCRRLYIIDLSSIDTEPQYHTVQISMNHSLLHRSRQCLTQFPSYWACFALHQGACMASHCKRACAAFSKI